MECFLNLSESPKKSFKLLDPFKKNKNKQTNLEGDDDRLSINIQSGSTTFFIACLNG